jgi:hypothetical protein
MPGQTTRIENWKMFGGPWDRLGNLSYGPLVMFPELNAQYD